MTPPSNENNRHNTIALIEKPDPFDHAIAQLCSHRTFRHAERTMTIAFLIRRADWRPLDAPWWCGKEVSIIGVDLYGNFFLRHCGGAVHYWDHRLQGDTVIAPSVREFADRIE